MTNAATVLRRKAFRWRTVLLAIQIVAVPVWWFTLAPPAMGGSTSYIIVQGHSMEPMLHTGDLVLAKVKKNYVKGELIAFQIYSGSVIHRIVSGNAESGYSTQGDNNNFIDPWIVPSGAIYGRYETFVPGFGHVLDWTNQNPLSFAGISALLSVLTYIPLKRRRLHPVLRDALREAAKEPRRDGRTNAEYGVLSVALLAAGASFYVFIQYIASKSMFTPQFGFMVLSLAMSGSFAIVLLYRLYDGRGVPEPAASNYALSGRLYLVDRFPELPDVEPAKSPVKLRQRAEELRLPVLHRIDPQTGVQEFLLITHDEHHMKWVAIPEGGAKEPKDPQDPKNPGAGGTGSQGRLTKWKNWWNASVFMQAAPEIRLAALIGAGLAAAVVVLPLGWFVTSSVIAHPQVLMWGAAFMVSAGVGVGVYMFAPSEEAEVRRPRWVVLRSVLQSARLRFFTILLIGGSVWLALREGTVTQASAIREQIRQLLGF